MEKNIELEWRMYGLVPYNISEIQKGIQFGHAVVEYGEIVKDIEDKYKDSESRFYDYTMKISNDYHNWAKNWKTFMILNGGTSNHTQNRYQVGEFNGTMEGHLKEISENGINYATFYEPDLNDMLSAIVFLVDERVFKLKPYFEGDTIYPDFDVKEYYGDTKFAWEAQKELEKNPMNPNFPTALNLKGEDVRKEWEKWVESIGGKKNLFLRTFIRKFRLA